MLTVAPMKCSRPRKLQPTIGHTSYTKCWTWPGTTKTAVAPMLHRFLRNFSAASPKKCCWPWNLRIAINFGFYSKYRLLLQWNAAGCSSYRLPFTTAPTQNVGCSYNGMPSTTEASYHHRPRLLRKILIIARQNKNSRGSYAPSLAEELKQQI